MAKFSTGLRAAMMSTGSALSVLNNAGMHVRIYAASVVPQTADEAESGTILMTVDGGMADLQLELLAGTASLVRDPSQTWKCDSVTTTGVMRYFRMCPTSDDGSVDAEAIRIQGTIGTVPGADLVVTDVNVTAAQEWVLNYFRLTLPTL